MNSSLQIAPHLRAVGRALVLAPHYDDEVLGCGGALCALLQEQARVTVCFLTDGAGGAEDQPGGQGGDRYARRRRAESELVADLYGWSETIHLDLPDGDLSSHEDELQRSLLEQLDTVDPDLVLLPSPAERTADHRSAHRIGLLAVQSWLRDHPTRLGSVLLYEVNQPQLADSLLDVSAFADRLRDAMALYASQQERHDYLGAALGLRCYRALELPPTVALAEAYTVLTYDRCRALPCEELLSQGLIPRQSGAPRFARNEAERLTVIVRTRDRPVLLRTALSSLAKTTCRPDRVVLVNDGGPSPELDGLELPFPVEKVDLDPGRGRAAAANAGLAAVETPLVAFLDDDDVVAPEHYQVLIQARRSHGVEIVYSDAAVVRMRRAEDGQWAEVDRSLPYAREFDPQVLVLDNYIPFHTLLLPTELVRRVGALDETLEVFEDWDLLVRLAQEVTFRHVAQTTCEYRHYEDSDHHGLVGTNIDRERWFVEARAKVLRKHSRLLDEATLAEAIGRLRREAVDLTSMVRQHQLQAAEDRGRQREQLAEARQQVSAEAERAARSEIEARLLEAEVQRLREVEASAASEIGVLSERLRAEAGQKQALEQARSHLAVRDQELRAQYQATAQLQESLDERGQALERAFGDAERLQAEVERLGGLVRAMESTRAWRVHQRLQRLVGRARPAGEGKATP